MRSLTRLRAYFFVAQPMELRTNNMLRANNPASFMFDHLPLHSKINGDAELFSASPIVVAVLTPATANRDRK
jgi:hypothetical protein